MLKNKTKTCWHLPDSKYVNVDPDYQREPMPRRKSDRMNGEPRRYTFKIPDWPSFGYATENQWIQNVNPFLEKSREVKKWVYMCLCMDAFGYTRKQKLELRKLSNMTFPSVCSSKLLTENIIIYFNLHLFIFKLCVQFTVGAETDAEEWSQRAGKVLKILSKCCS